MDPTDIDVQITEEDIGILLVGNAGSGKSSTGNSLIGRTVFEAKGGFISVTRKHHVGTTNINGRVVKVVDIPGFNDTELSNDQEKLELVINEITSSLSQFPNGFHAVVLVIPYCHRFTDDEKKIIDTIVGFLGSDSLESHGILALTHGDSFKRDYPSGNAYLEEWLESLPMRFQWLREICGGRCVLMDNTIKDDNQRKRLIELVSSLDSKSRYIPDICKTPKNQSMRLIRDREQLMKYVKVSLTIDVFSAKVKKETVTNEAQLEKLKKSANDVVKILTGDKVFNSENLQKFSKEINSLRHNDDEETVNKKIDNIQIIIQNLQEKNDAKIRSTESWQSLKKRVANFFQSCFSCEIL